MTAVEVIEPGAGPRADSAGLDTPQSEFAHVDSGRIVGLDSKPLLLDPIEVVGVIRVLWHQMSSLLVGRASRRMPMLLVLLKNSLKRDVHFLYIFLE